LVVVDRIDRIRMAKRMASAWIAAGMMAYGGIAFAQIAIDEFDATPEVPNIQCDVIQPIPTQESEQIDSMGGGSDSGKRAMVD
jgi:Cu/Ag efflux pump CusA